MPGGLDAVDRPCRVQVERSLPRGQLEPAPARAWAELTGDAGWAGLLAASAMERPAKPVVVVFEPGMDTLALVGEALALLPRARRWQVTFSTYRTSTPRAAECLWRFCLEGSSVHKEAQRARDLRLVDLTQGRALGAPSEAMVSMRGPRRIWAWPMHSCSRAALRPCA